MSSKGEEEIDIDDPDFWQKWAKKADLDVDLINKVCSLHLIFYTSQHNLNCVLHSCFI